MDIIVYMSPTCDHTDEILQLMEECLAECGVSTGYQTVETRDFEDAKEKKSLGCPTIRTNGVDIEYGPQESEEYTSGCRYYNTLDGWKPMPPKNLIIGGIKRAQEKQ